MLAPGNLCSRCLCPAPIHLLSQESHPTYYLHYVDPDLRMGQERLSLPSFEKSFMGMSEREEEARSPGLVALALKALLCVFCISLVMFYIK